MHRRGMPTIYGRSLLVSCHRSIGRAPADPSSPHRERKPFFFSILSGSLFFFCLFLFYFFPFFFYRVSLSFFFDSVSVCVCVCVCALLLSYSSSFSISFSFFFLSLSLHYAFFVCFLLNINLKKNSGTKKKEPTFVYGAADRSVATKSATFFFLFPFFFKFGWEMTR